MKTKGMSYIFSTYLTVTWYDNFWHYVFDGLVCLLIFLLFVRKDLIRHSTVDPSRQCGLCVSPHLAFKLDLTNQIYATTFILPPASIKNNMTIQVWTVAPAIGLPTRAL